MIQLTEMLKLVQQLLYQTIVPPVYKPSWKLMALLHSVDFLFNLSFGMYLHIHVVG
jgi:hypothetical protein